MAAVIIYVLVTDAIVLYSRFLQSYKLSKLYDSTCEVHTKAIDTILHGSHLSSRQRSVARTQSQCMPLGRLRIRTRGHKRGEKRRIMSPVELIVRSVFPELLGHHKAGPVPDRQEERNLRPRQAAEKTIKHEMADLETHNSTTIAKA